MNDENLSEDAGFGLVGFLLSLHSLAVKTREGDLTASEVAEILSRSRKFIDTHRVSGNPQLVTTAVYALNMAEETLTAASIQRPKRMLD